MKKKLSAIIIAQMLIIISTFAAITAADENEIQWPLLGFLMMKMITKMVWLIIWMLKTLLII